MNESKFIWHNGTLKPWSEAQTHVLTHTLHYGGGAFEGIRAYKTDKGPAVFRLKEHIDRLFYSASTLKMEIPFSKDQLQKALCETIHENGLEHCYIRPIVYFGYGVMGLKPFGAPTDVAIACWPWGAYLPHDAVDIKISKYTRIHPNSTVVDAKLCGHYVNSIFSTIEIRDTHYHEALLLDYQGKVAEGPGENFFMIKDGKIITPKPGTILCGITRDTVFQIAKSMGLSVIEADILPEQALKADEAFFTGTAAEVTPIRSIGDTVLGSGSVGKITEQIKSTYLDIVYGRNSKFEHFLTYVTK